MLSCKNCLPCTLPCNTSALRDLSLGPSVSVNCSTYQNLPQTFKMLPARPMLSQTSSPCFGQNCPPGGFTMPTLQPIRPMPRGKVIQSKGHCTEIKGQCLWRGQLCAAVLPLTYSTKAHHCSCMDTVYVQCGTQPFPNHLRSLVTFKFIWHVLNKDVLGTFTESPVGTPLTPLPENCQLCRLPFFLSLFYLPPQHHG